MLKLASPKDWSVRYHLLKTFAAQYKCHWSRMCEDGSWRRGHCTENFSKSPEMESALHFVQTVGLFMAWLLVATPLGKRYLHTSIWSLKELSWWSSPGDRNSLYIYYLHNYTPFHTTTTINYLEGGLSHVPNISFCKVSSYQQIKENYKAKSNIIDKCTKH